MGGGASGLGSGRGRGRARGGGGRREWARRSRAYRPYHESVSGCRHCRCFLCLCVRFSNGRSGLTPNRWCSASAAAGATSAGAPGSRARPEGTRGARQPGRARSRRRRSAAASAASVVARSARSSYGVIRSSSAFRSRVPGASSASKGRAFSRCYRAFRVPDASFFLSSAECSISSVCASSSSTGAVRASARSARSPVARSRRVRSACAVGGCNYYCTARAQGGGGGPLVPVPRYASRPGLAPRGRAEDVFLAWRNPSAPDSTPSRRRAPLGPRPGRGLGASTRASGEAGG